MRVPVEQNVSAGEICKECLARRNDQLITVFLFIDRIVNSEDCIICRVVYGSFRIRDFIDIPSDVSILMI